ncbi:MAG TPA: hypothetical protein VKB50_11985 [Vicinamibacterales bacterium]|nr:hypothetical protein [Vicinamibacterales bacterium]
MQRTLAASSITQQRSYHLIDVLRHLTADIQETIVRTDTAMHESHEAMRGADRRSALGRTVDDRHAYGIGFRSTVLSVGIGV